MQMKSFKAIGVALTCGMVVAACQSLDVPNFNNPSIDQAKLNPSNLEQQSGTAFRYMFTVMQGSDVRNQTTYFPSMAESCMGNEMTIGTTDLGNNQDVCLEPRTEMNNFDQGQWINRTPYQMLYGGIATANDVLEGTLTLGVKIGVPTPQIPQGVHTDRNIWWSTFMVGIGNTYLGFLFDKAIPVQAGVPYTGIEVNPDQFKPYTEVSAVGLTTLRKAIDLATAAPEDSTLPAWVNGTQLSKAEAIRLMNSFVARNLAYTPRTPAERAAVDWAAVIAAVDAGITKDLVQQAVSNNRGTISYYKNLVQLQTDARPSNRLVGPADISGVYQTWLNTPVDQRDAITINSGDKRISNVDINTAGTNVTPGAYIQLNTARSQGLTLGNWILSSYRGVKFGLGTTNSNFDSGIHTLVSVTEMQLLKAEALIRLGGAANLTAAANIINVTRTRFNGTGTPAATNNLAPVTAAGVPAAANCVPRRDNGTCGDLMDALMWESRIENFGLEGTIAWANARGWGTLLSGTVIHFPIPGRELQTFKMAYYTFGGPNSTGSAP